MKKSEQRFSFLAALGVALTLAGCSSDPLGGWKTPGQGGIFACFHADGTLSTGDHADEATRLPAPLKWTDDGKITGRDLPPGTTWKLDGDDLVLNVPCMGEGCGVITFKRDDSFGCK